MRLFEAEVGVREVISTAVAEALAAHGARLAIWLCATSRPINEPDFFSSFLRLCTVDLVGFRVWTLELGA
jgi:hypothetical protein